MMNLYRCNGYKTVILAGKFTLNELKSQLSGINPGDSLENQIDSSPESSKQVLVINMNF